MDDSVVREVLEDIVTIVCGDSSLFSPFVIRPPRRCRWRSASPVNIPPKKSNENKCLEPKREPKLIETGEVSCSSSSISKSRSGNTSSEMLLSDSAVSASKLQSRCRDHDESQSSLSDGNRKLHKRKRSRSRSRSRSPSSSDDIYVCNVCSDEFRRPQVLCHHLYRNHQLPSCCAYCNKHFYDTTLLMKHIKAAHAGRTSFDCWFCTLKPSGMRQFWDHMWRYHKKNMFRCRCGQICFSAHCFHAHQALCSKLKIKSFHDVRWDATLSKPSNKHIHENKRRQKFYNEGYQEKKQKFLENGCEKVMQNNEVFLTNAMQCSAAWTSPPIYQNDNVNVSPPIYPTDGNVMPPMNFYPMQTVFGFNANLKDPRIQKKLNANGDCGAATAAVASTKSVDESKGVDDKESSPPDIPMASSTPVNDFKKMSGPIEISNVISQAKKKSTNGVAAAPSISLTQPKPHWLNLTPIGSGFGEYNSSGSDRKPAILSPISPPEFECFPNSTVKLLTDFCKQTHSSSSPSSSKVLSCGCKTGSINHEVCDILKDLKQEMDMAETPSRSASTVLSPRFQIDSVTVTETINHPSVGTNVTGSIAGGIAHGNLLNIPASIAISNEDMNVATSSSKMAPKLIPKKSDDPPATMKSNLKLSTKNVVQVLSKNRNVKPTGVRKEKSSGVIDLTSPIKNKEKSNKISNAVAVANQRAVKILPFAKVEQIHQKLAEKMMNKEISSQSDKIQIKAESIDDTTSKKDSAKQKCNRKSTKSAVSVDLHEQVQPSSSIKKVLDSKTTGPVTTLYQQTIVATAAIKSPESYIPPKKRWASEFVESAKCLEKQKASSITSSATVSTSPTTTSDRIETEFQCDLCDYRCSKKKSMEKHLIKKHCLSVVAERYVNFYKTYEICKTVVVDGDEPRHLVNRENIALSVKYDHLRKEVALLKQCFSLMKPEMNR